MKQILFNLHTHSHYCDGKSAPEEYVKSAISKGFHTLGFTGHAPVPFENSFAIKDEDSLLAYAQEVSVLKNQYKNDLSIFLGLEIDFIPGILEDFDRLKQLAGLDYVIGGVHLVRNGQDENLWFIDGSRQEIYDNGLNRIFDGDIRHAVSTYWQQIRTMIETQHPDIVAHLDKIKMHNKNRFFTEDEPWYEHELDKTLEVIAQKKTIVEVNTRGIYKGRSDELFPGIKALKKIRELGIPITLNADAHHPEELDNYFEEAKEILRKTGFRKLNILTGQGWQEVDF
jgi:histidinol-phosphatase (PHP family)